MTQVQHAGNTRSIDLSGRWVLAPIQASTRFWPGSKAARSLLISVALSLSVLLVKVFRRVFNQSLSLSIIMLVVGPDSTCDVCLESYTNGANVPHAITCGHVFCQK